VRRSLWTRIEAGHIRRGGGPGPDRQQLGGEDHRREARYGCSRPPTDAGRAPEAAAPRGLRCQPLQVALGLGTTRRSSSDPRTGVRRNGRRQRRTGQDRTRSAIPGCAAQGTASWGDARGRALEPANRQYVWVISGKTGRATVGTGRAPIIGPWRAVCTERGAPGNSHWTASFHGANEDPSVNYHSGEATYHIAFTADRPPCLDARHPPSGISGRIWTRAASPSWPT
jgi:hypothetical protein